MAALHRRGPHMAESEILPRSVVVLGDALRPVSRRLAARLADAPMRSTHCPDAVLFVQDQLDRVQRDLRALTDEVNGEVARVAAPDAADADVWRAVSRLEVHIERILDGYDRLRRTRAEAGDGAGVLLLGDVYRRLLRQVETWLNDIIAFVDDPIAAAKKRGLVAEGRVEFSIRLVPDATAQLTSVLDWLDERDEQQRREVDKEERAAKRGLLWLVLSFFGLGWILGA